MGSFALDTPPREERLGNQQMDRHKEIMKSIRNGTFVDISEDYDDSDARGAGDYDDIAVRTCCHVCLDPMDIPARIVALCARHGRRPVCSKPKCQKNAWKQKNRR